MGPRSTCALSGVSTVLEGWRGEEGAEDMPCGPKGTLFSATLTTLESMVLDGVDAREVRGLWPIEQLGSDKRRFEWFTMGEEPGDVRGRVTVTGTDMNRAMAALELRMHGIALGADASILLKKKSLRTPIEECSQESTYSERILASEEYSPMNDPCTCPSVSALHPSKLTK